MLHWSGDYDVCPYCNGQGCGACDGMGAFPVRQREAPGWLVVVVWVVVMVALSAVVLGAIAFMPDWRRG